MRKPGGFLAAAVLTTAATLVLTGCAPGGAALPDGMTALELDPFPVVAVGDVETAAAAPAFDSGFASVLPELGLDAATTDALAARVASADAAVNDRLIADFAAALPAGTAFATGTAGLGAAAPVLVGVVWQASTHLPEVQALADGASWTAPQSGVRIQKSGHGLNVSLRTRYGGTPGGAGSSVANRLPRPADIGDDWEGESIQGVDMSEACPAGDGKAHAEMVVTLTAAATGDGPSYRRTENYEIKIDAVLNDAAQPETLDVQINTKTDVDEDSGARSVETAESITDAGSKTGGKAQSTAGSTGRPGSREGELGQHAAERARQLADGLIETLMQMWNDGGCVDIVVTGAQSVQPDSDTPIRVAVEAYVRGGDAPSKVTLSLSGAGEISKTSLTSTDDLNYHAGEAGRSAHIVIEAMSKRGRDQDLFDIQIGTPHFFLLAAQFDQYSGTGWLCFSDAGKVYGGTGAVIGAVVESASGDMIIFNDGEVAAGGIIDGYGVAAKGSYTIGDDPSGLPATISGSASGSRTRIGSPSDTEPISGPVTGTLTLPDPANPRMEEACATGAAPNPSS